MPDAPHSSPDDAPPPTPVSAPEPAERDFVAEYRRREREQRETASWHRLSGAAGEFAVAVGLGALAGWGLDKWLGTAPWLLIVGVLVGFALGLFLLVRMAGKAFK